MSRVMGGVWNPSEQIKRLREKVSKLEREAVERDKKIEALEKAIEHPQDPPHKTGCPCHHCELERKRFG